MIIKVISTATAAAGNDEFLDEEFQASEFD